MPIVNPTYAPIPYSSRHRYTSFKQFYPFYLGQHANVTCRRLHVIGTLSAVALATTSLALQQPSRLLVAPLVAYAFAWVGHFFFEKNTPATFQHPWYSFRGDLTMFYETVVLRQRPF